MSYDPFGEDDPFADQNGAGAPESPIRLPPTMDEDMPDEEELKRIRRESLAKLIEERRAIAKEAYAQKVVARVVARVLEVTITPDPSPSFIPPLTPSADALPGVSYIVGPSATLPVEQVRSGRVLNRHNTSTSDPPVLPLEILPVRRRLNAKCPNTKPGSFPYKQSVQLPIQGTGTVFPLDAASAKTDDTAVANQGVLSDPEIGAALAQLSDDVLTNKMINARVNRTLCRAGVIRHCRELLLSKIKRGLLGTKAVGMTIGRQLQWGASQYLTMMNVLEKCRLYRLILNELRTENKEEELMAFLCYLYRKEQPLSDECNGKGQWIHGKNVVLTYQGAWGLIPWNNELRSAKGDIKQLCKILSELNQTQDLFVEACSLCTDTLATYSLKDVHCSIELCTKTLQDDDVLRAHVHVALEARYGKLIKVSHPSRLPFQNSWPCKSSADNEAIQTRAASAGASCAYYLRMPKIGMILNWGTKKPNDDFRINPDWILAYLQSGKITPDDAMMEISKTWKQCKSLIDNIQWNIEWQEKIKLKAFVASQQDVISATRTTRKYRA